MALTVWAPAALCVSVDRGGPALYDRWLEASASRSCITVLGCFSFLVYLFCIFLPLKEERGRLDGDMYVGLLLRGSILFSGTAGPAAPP